MKSSRKSHVVSQLWLAPFLLLMSPHQYLVSHSFTREFPRCPICITCPYPPCIPAVNLGGNPSSTDGGPQGQNGGEGTNSEPGSKASKKEEKKRKHAEQQQAAEGEEAAGAGLKQQQQQPQPQAGTTASKKAKGNAEEARRIREALGYVPPSKGSSGGAAAAVEKSEAAVTAVPTQDNKRFAFGFNIQQQVSLVLLLLVTC